MNSKPIQVASANSTSSDYTLFIVVTNRDIFLKECMDSFRRFYPGLKIVLIDNSGSGHFKLIGKSLGLEVQANDHIKAVTENQNWILDHCKTKYFVFSADDIVFLQKGFLEDALALHQKGFELVSFGVDDPCAFSMPASSNPKIGRFNVALSGKEKTDLDIKARCEAVYGFLPSIGGYWRETDTFWESKYIKHYRFKPDVNNFLKERGMAAGQIHNEGIIEKNTRLLGLLRLRAATFLGAPLMKYSNLILRKGLPQPVFEIRNQLPKLNWRNKRILSIGQVPRHYFWPQHLGHFLGNQDSVEKVIVEKCEAYKSFLVNKFTAEEGFKIVADDVLNVDKFLKPRSVDLTVWYDGPEHLEKDLAREALRTIELVTDGLILIGTPRGFHPQGTDDSFKKIQNPFNTHLSGWELSEFQTLGYKTHVCEKSIPTIIAWKHSSEEK
jgi:hypothetical protein